MTYPTVVPVVVANGDGEGIPAVMLAVPIVWSIMAWVSKIIHGNGWVSMMTAQDLKTLLVGIVNRLIRRMPSLLY